ncbi:MAG: FISUMP domain-containing protein [Bacteroidales bacterium]|jgi:uncharacterized protein (TIGR02145 family)
MKKNISIRSALIIIMVVGSITLYGQDISVTFTGTGAATQIDSVKATNLTTNQRVTFPGKETLVLNANTGIPTVSNLTHTGIVYPNPFVGSTTFSMAVQQPQRVYLRIQNQIGQVVAQTKVWVQPGNNEFALIVNTAGIYMVSLTADQGTASINLICTDASESENRIQYLGAGPNNHHQPGLKTSQTGYTLGYKSGEIILYKCYSGIYTTIVTDSPTTSKHYKVEFIACTDPDGKNYSIINIGGQRWMAENLAFLPSVSLPSSGSDLSPLYYVYGYFGTSVEEAKASPNYATYGVMYNWDAAKTACPPGWHLPSYPSLLTLTNILGATAGGDMKETGTEHWHSPNAGATNASGFSALPGGGCHYSFGFYSLGYTASFWSSTDAYYDAWCQPLIFDSDGSGQGMSHREEGYSVRCLKDGDANTIPTASFVFAPTRGIPSTIFQFDASGSADAETVSDDLEVRWDWDGDGTWDTDYSKLKTNSCQYDSSGSYLAIVEVKDSGGLLDTETKIITVSDGSFTDSRDGHEYLYQTIGTQTWMAENLAYLPSVSPSIVGSETSSYYYVYGYEGSSATEARKEPNYTIYGVLYNWGAANVVCPLGWHLPADEEWTVLTDYLRGSAGDQMKEMGTLHWASPNIRANNKSGFTALPGGRRSQDGGFFSIGNHAFFWSSSTSGLSDAYSRNLDFDFNGVSRAHYSKSRGYSVRCIRD